MKVLTIVGARPQFIKAAMVSRAFRKFPSVCEKILHTGQHFDRKMSAVFFRELNLLRPYKNLGCAGQGLHGEQTAKMLVGIENECLKQRPDWILVYGDTNSTLAGALVAAKLHIPLAHVEAGLRSFNMRMPEEINRIVTDRLSTLLFAPTTTAVKNLNHEGIHKGVHRVGDVMIDAIYYYRDLARALPIKRIRRIVPIEPFFVLTLHRQENTDDPRRLYAIFSGLANSPYTIIFPIHPRTRKTLKRAKFHVTRKIHMIEPVSYLEMILLQDRSAAVWTDSGGMQKEAVVLQKPCFTLRDETEWIETVRIGWNHLVGADAESVRRHLSKRIIRGKRPRFPTRTHYGDGRAAEKIARLLARA